MGRPTYAGRVLVAVVAGATAVALAVPSRVAPPRASTRGVLQTVGDRADDPSESTGLARQRALARSAPGNIAPGAYTAAFQHVAAMPVAATSWNEVTHKPYNNDDPHYRDWYDSNSGSGVGYLTGRVTGVAADGTYVYAGSSSGGVFRSSDDGQHWTPISDGLPSLSTGDLRLAPDGSLWLATGEANFGDALGSGVYRLPDPRTGTFSLGQRVGGTELESHSIGKLEIDAATGTVFAATSRGVYRHSLSSTSGAWQSVLRPVAAGDPSLTAFSNITNDVVVQPGTHGKRVLANLAWRAGAPQNGFYLSTDGGTRWAKINPTGAINPAEVGPANMAFSADGSKLYVVMESPALFNKDFAYSSLAGVYASATGSVTGPFTQVATSKSLAETGSAQKMRRIGRGYGPGVQAWYTRFLAVDPADASHVYLGLEEVYESRTAGRTWKTIGRYWNFNFPCFSRDDTKNTCDGNVLHPDQHTAAFAAGRLYVGNDGGLYSRSTAASASSWTSLSRSGDLDLLQYYSVGVGRLPGGGVAVWGGLQDNGVSLLKSGAATMVSPMGGDGGDTIVDTLDGCRSVGEFPGLLMYMTTNCGESDGTVRATTDIEPADPNPLFIAPFAADSVDPGYWVAGGQFVWQNSKTWSSTSGADWTPLADNGSYVTGVYRSSSAVASQNHVVWSGWCGPCTSLTWQSGISTTYGTGVLHEVSFAGLPNRYITGITIDPADPSGGTVYAVFNGFTGKWVEGYGNGLGHVFKTVDGGAHWTDVSGAPAAADSLPDAPASRLAITPDHTLVLASDTGVYVSTVDGHWRRAGTGLPYTIADDVRVGPDGYTYVATYGRGIWRMPTP